MDVLVGFVLLRTRARNAKMSNLRERRARIAKQNCRFLCCCCCARIYHQGVCLPMRHPSLKCFRFVRVLLLLIMQVQQYNSSMCQVWINYPISHLGFPAYFVEKKTEDESSCIGSCEFIVQSQSLNSQLWTISQYVRHVYRRQQLFELWIGRISRVGS